MNAWFPRLNAAGVIASGNAGIWLTDAAGSRQVSPIGIGPVWAGSTLIFNRNDDKSTDVGGVIVPAAFNDYRGSEDDRWAGFFAPANGRTDVYRGTVLQRQIPDACAPRFGGSLFAYLTPYQSNTRTLMINDQPVVTDIIMDVQLSRGGEFYVYMVATGTYTRLIRNESHEVISIRNDEVPLVAFLGPNNERWLLSGTQGPTWVRPEKSNMGYVIDGELYYPDARMIGDRLRVVGSYSNGTPRFEEWIDFTKPRTNLLTPTVVIPTFSFTHKVMVAPFKDPLAETAAPVEILVNQNSQRATRRLFVADDTLMSTWKGPLLGIYTEAKGDALTKVQQSAVSLGTRVLVIHDSQTPWSLPAGLRSCDIPGVELYRYKVPVEETLAQALERWRRDVVTMLQSWPGDCAVVPMFYCMGGIPGGNPPELWPVSDVLDTQRHLSDLVNLSPRIKVVAPFSYQRGNGIVAHTEFQQSFANLLAAAPQVPDLLPVPKPPDPPDPPKPSNPFPPALPGKAIMTPFKAALRLGAHFFTRVDPTPNLAPWPDWCLVRADRTDQNDPDCEWEITMPEGPGNTKLRAVHVKTGRTLTFDFTEYGGNVCQGFFGSPESAGWFGYQQLSGWTLGPGGPEVVTVDYSIVGTKAAAPCLTVVRL